MRTLGISFILASVGAVTLSGVAAAAPLASGGQTLYAYASGTATTAGCAQSSTVAAECSFGQALSQAQAGDIIELATPGASAHYVGNWTVATTGTTATSPLTIEALSGLTGPPVLDGNLGSATGCSTGSCDGPILDLNAGVNLTVSGIDVNDGDNTADDIGGAIETGDDVAGGTVTINDDSFTDDQSALDGGAIDNANSSKGSGTLTVVDSTFTDDATSDGGGAIDNGNNGDGMLTVKGSSFSGDNAFAGGAIDDGDGGNGSATVSGSTFDSDTAGISNDGGDGGGIDVGDYGGSGTLMVTNSTFSNDTAESIGGGIAASAGQTGTTTVTVSSSTFDKDSASFGGGIGNPTDTAMESLDVSESTFTGNSASDGGGAIDTGAASSETSTLVVVGSTLADDSSSDGPGISTYGPAAVVVAADLFDETCDESAGTVTDDGRNAAIDTSCADGGVGDVASPSVGTTLNPLASNGGPTETMSVAATNPAFALVPAGATAAGSPASLRALCPRTDQTGHVAAPNTACDAGAVDLATPLRPTLTESGGPVVAVGSSVKLSGKARPGATVKLYAAGNDVAAMTATSSGAFTFARKIGTSQSYAVVADGSISPIERVTAIRLTLAINSDHATGHAPAGHQVVLLRDGKRLATTMPSRSNTYRFGKKLTGKYRYQISCDGETSPQIKTKK